MRIHYILLTLLLLNISSCAYLFNDDKVAISINSSPPGANIIIEGKNYGVTPATIKIEAKNYEVKLVKDGYGSTTIKTEAWGAVRDGGDGKRCIADLLNPLLFFSAYSKYCADFKQKEYFATIPYVAVENAQYNNATSQQPQRFTPSAIDYYYKQDSTKARTQGSN
jgi:hypothetical protein